MIIEHDHRDATFSREADKLEMEIETIEQSVINLTRELISKLRRGVINWLCEPRVILFIVVFIIFCITGSPFSWRANMKRQIYKLRKQNNRLKKQNRRLQQMISKRRECSSVFFRF